MEDRTRPFLKVTLRNPPGYEGGDAYWIDYVKRERQHHPDFDDFLKEIEVIIKKRELKYCDNIIKFINYETNRNVTKNLTTIFVKLYNYVFSPSQAVDYIEESYNNYVYLLNAKLKITSCTFVSKRGGEEGDYVAVHLQDFERKYPIIWHFIVFTFRTTIKKNIDDACIKAKDVEVEIKSYQYNRIYEDSLILFDFYQGNQYLNKLLKTVIEELKKIINVELRK